MSHRLSGSFVGSKYDSDGGSQGSSDLCLDETFRCPICRRSLKTPKLLTCGHSFCRLCLRKMVHSLSQTSLETAGSYGAEGPLSQGSVASHAGLEMRLSCPVCGVPTKMAGPKEVDSLPDNHALVDAMARLQTKQHPHSSSWDGLDHVHPPSGCSSNTSGFGRLSESEHCNMCVATGKGEAQRGEPRHFCFKCAKYLCQDCYELHAVRMREHTTVVDLESNVNNLLEVMCPTHYQPHEYFCITCLVALCSACRMDSVEHPPNHSIVSNFSANHIQRMRSDIMTRKSHIRATEATCRQHAQTAGKVQHAIREHYAQVDTDIRQWRTAMIKAVDEHCKELQKIRDAHGEHTAGKGTQALERDFNFHVTECRSVLEYCDQILSNKTDFMPLSLFGNLLRTMKELSTTTPKMPLDVTVEVIELSDGPRNWGLGSIPVLKTTRKSTRTDKIQLRNTFLTPIYTSLCSEQGVSTVSIHSMSSYRTNQSGQQTEQDYLSLHPPDIAITGVSDISGPMGLLTYHSPHSHSPVAARRSDDRQAPSQLGDDQVRYYGLQTVSGHSSMSNLHQGRRPSNSLSSPEAQTLDSCSPREMDVFMYEDHSTNIPSVIPVKKATFRNNVSNEAIHDPHVHISSGSGQTTDQQKVKLYRSEPNLQELQKIEEIPHSENKEVYHTIQRSMTVPGDKISTLPNNMPLGRTDSNVCKSEADLLSPQKSKKKGNKAMSLFNKFNPFNKRPSYTNITDQSDGSTF